MRALTATELLQVWERGATQPLAYRMLALLAAACPDASGEALAELPIGERDRRLLRLRQWMFGPKLATVTSCPKCGERLESSLDVSQMLAHAAPVGATGHEPGTVAAGGYRVTFRLPTTRDLITAPETDLRTHLLARCVLDARDANDEAVVAEALPEDVVAEVSRAMAASDPHAAIELALDCPACTHLWRSLFDVPRFFWAEIGAWAQRTLREVHCLARAYGWCEADVLALSPTRRRIYLELSRA